MQTCECGQSFMSAFNLKRHKSSKTHEFNMLCVGENIISDESGMYNCNICNYSTVFKGNYRKHIISTKHKTLKAKRPPTETKRDDSFQIENAIVSGDNNFKPEMVMQFISTMMNQQHEFQMNMVNKFVSRDTEHSTVSTLDHSIQNSHNPTTTNSHNTTTNTKFNLNVFLNEDCKNAMNPDEPEGFCRGNDQPRP